jgi:protein TonB
LFLFLFLVSRLLADGELKVAEADAKRAAIQKPAPGYPAAARQLNVTGRVDLVAVVGLDGSVEEVRVVTGNPILTKACGDAVKNWKFTPFRQDGKVVRAAASLSFDFRQ